MDVLDEVVEFLYGGAIDPREMRDLISKMTDASDVHVQAPIKVKRTKAEQQKLQAQVGLASNIVGLTAGGAALVSASKDERFKSGGKIARAIYRGGKKLPSISPKAGRAGAIAASGALGLQAANTAGDVVANRVLDREARKKVQKSLDDIVQARRDGYITTDQAIEMSADLVERVEKSAQTAVWAVSDKTKKVLKPIATKKGRAAMRQQKALDTYSGNVLVASAPKAQKAALTTTAVVAGGGGIYTGKKMQQNKYERGAYVSNPFGKSITWEGEISKIDADKRQVFGWCSISEVDGQPVTDLQGDYVPIEETEKSAYEYVIKSRKGGDMHARVSKDWREKDEPMHVADLIESFVVTPEKLEQMGLPGDALPKGWWVGFKVSDDKVWEMVKTGERAGFSIHGSGKRTEKHV